MIRLIALTASLFLLACHDDHPRDCGGPLPGGYEIDFARAVFACEPDAFPESVSLGESVFSSNGCEITLDGDACRGGPGYCGHLYWTEHGVYSGELTYVTMNDTGNSGGFADCLIHSEEAVLTAIDAD